MREAASKLYVSGSDTPRLDAELLLAHVLGATRTAVLAQPEAPVGSGQQERFAAMIERRAQGEPVAYIRGIKEFYGLALAVDPRALIPRPETETLVGLALDRIRDALIAWARPADAAPLLVWDVGTGSGAIAITLAVECRRRGYASDVRIRATDVSPDALALAKENAVGHAVADAIDFALSDLADPGELPFGRDRRPVDLLLANLPYVPSMTVPQLPAATSYEPSLALDGGSDGMEVIGRLLAQLPESVAAGGRALLEIGSDQGQAVRQLGAELLSDWHIELHADLAGRPRVAELSRKAAP